MKTLNAIAALIISIGSGMLGYNITSTHHSHIPFIWGVLDFLFWPIAWIKWLICHDVNFSIIKSTFGFLLN